MKLYLVCLTAISLLVGCKSDRTAPTPNEQTAVQAASPTDASAVRSTTAAAGEFSMSGIEGFNYLTDCDSFLVSSIDLQDPESAASYTYLMGSCVTNKSYDVIAVPKAGHTPSAEFGDPEQVLAKTQASSFEDYIVYAMMVPKIFRAEESKVLNIFPANVVVHRLDPPRWNRLGVDRVEDATAYDAFLWNVLHDGQLKYD